MTASRTIKIISLFYCISLMTACSTTTDQKDNVKNEASALKENVLKFVVRNSKDAFDELYPIFNSEIADTKYNKERFKEFLQVPIAKDVNNIYCFNDNVGANADYMFSFNCNQGTVNKIIAKHHLKESNQKDKGFALQHSDFEWWNKKRIQQLPFYKNTPTNETKANKYFWFDEKNNKAYFFEFTL